VWIFVNSFYFIFLEFLAIYWANFFPWAKKAKKGGTRETGSDRPPKQGGPTGPVGPWRRFAPVFPRNAPFRLPSLVKKFEGKFE
jgi:hypothetical protein